MRKKSYRRTVGLHEMPHNATVGLKRFLSQTRSVSVRYILNIIIYITCLIQVSTETSKMNKIFLTDSGRLSK